VESISEQISVLIFSKHAMFRDGLKLVLDDESGFNVVGSTGDRDQAVHLVVQLRPDLLLFEMNTLHLYPAGSDLEFLRQLMSKGNNLKSVLLTTSNEEKQIVEALKLGVRGVIRKEAGTSLLFKCMYSVLDGRYWIGRGTICELIKSFESLNAMLEHRSNFLNGQLSGRELQVIKEIVSGSSNRDIAQSLSISEQGVKYHLTKIFSKTGMSSRMELARFVIRHQLVREA
jgi:two-component system, NarL family, nitrate/nitrite response regulator NarL